MKTMLERLEDKFLLGDECWPWIAARYTNGYGHVEHGGKSLLAHKVIYELLCGPVPAGMDLDHRCHNDATGCPGGPSCVHRTCVRPDHLVPVTRRANVQAGALGRRTHCKHGHSLADALIHHGRRECRECNRRRCAQRRET